MNLEEESLKSKVIFPIDRTEQDEDGISVVRIKALKYEDVKKSVLDFKHIYIENCKHNIITNVKTIDEIFGDFEK
jgi:hypothetical protein